MSSVRDKDIINKFREMVGKRYEYTSLSERFDLPDAISEEVIAEIEEYFLDSIYPEAQKRQELEEAFAGLGSYVRSPRKIWGLLGNMSRALFKFGRQFPTALRAGMNGLEAFMGAKDFEAQMVHQAHLKVVQGEISDEMFERLMARLEKKDVTKFINDVRKLFKTMTNTTLIHKTIHILDSVVETMNDKKNIYPQKEIDGILLGRSILVGGYELFSKYDEATKQLMVEYIFKNEMWYTDHVFNTWQKEEQNG
ncbi:MAG: hypothetical protein GY751_13740 [Bacteroidetes bacterium]|nr:hypothetical protein [Bacteroidota bacterium]